MITSDNILAAGFILNETNSKLARVLERQLDCQAALRKAEKRVILATKEAAKADDAYRALEHAYLAQESKS